MCYFSALLVAFISPSDKKQPVYISPNEIDSYMWNSVVSFVIQVTLDGFYFSFSKIYSQFYLDK